MNIDVESLLIDLRTLSKIGPGVKLNTKESTIKLDDTTMLQGSFRWYRGDSRNSTYDKVHMIVQNSMKIVKMAINDFADRNFTGSLSVYLESTPEEFLNMMYHILVGVKAGLEKLKNTYSDDLELVSRFEMDITYVINQLVLIKRNIEINTRRMSVTDTESASVT
jgi:hypothetical protein